MGTTFTYGGVSSEEFGIMVLRVNRPLLSPTRDRRLVIATRHGEWDFGPYLSSRQIDLTCSILGDDRADLLSKLEGVAAWLNPMTGYRQLIISDQADRGWSALYSGALDVDLLLAEGGFVIPFVVTAVSPTALVPTVAEADVVDGAGLAASNSGAQTAPFTLTATLAAGADPYTGFVAGLGSAPQPGISEVTFSIGTLWMKYAGSLSAGDTLVIDTEERTCKLNGTSVLNKFSGSWLTLPIGVDSLVQDNPEGLAVHLKVEFTPVLV